MSFYISPLLKIPHASRARKEKRDPCVFCWKPIKKGQMKFHYDTGYSQTRRSEYWDIHVICYNALLKLSIKQLQKIYKEVFK